MHDASNEAQYNPSQALPGQERGNYRPYVARYVQLSALARSQVPLQADLRYGQQPRQRLDFFPAGQPGAGLLVFIHGGYWQELCKEDSCYLAPAWRGAGFAHAVLGYTLAPQARVSEMVQECRLALHYLRSHAAQLGFDAQRIVVAGSSAGAYLAAACAADADLQIKGMALLSGLYDLRPLLSTSINDALHMDAAEAEYLSSLVQGQALVPAVMAWGQVETEAFKVQSRALAAQLQAAGTPCTTLEVPARNHFDVVHELSDVSSAVFQACFKLFE